MYFFTDRHLWKSSLFKNVCHLLMKFFTPNFLRHVLLYKGNATKALLMQKNTDSLHCSVIFYRSQNDNLE